MIYNAIGCSIGTVIGHLLFDTSLIAMLVCWAVAFVVVQIILEHG